MRTMVLCLVLTTVAAACGGERGDADGPTGWKTEVVFTAPAKLGGLDVGDLDPDRPGDEIATVCLSGQMFLISRGADGWKGELMVEVPGEMIQCAIADADPRSPGNELVAVGMDEGTENDGGKGAVHVVSRTADGWKSERVHVANALVHGVCVADLDPDREGNEILAVGFDRLAVLIYRTEEGWVREIVASLPGNGKNAVAYKGGAAIATSTGRVDLLRKTGTRWGLETLVTTGAGQSRLGTDGSRLLSAGDDGRLLFIDGETATPVHAETQKLRGAVLADLDPDEEGVEAATAGYEFTISVLYPEDDWRAVAVFTDTAKFHHLASGQLDPDTPQEELAACGYSGRVVVVSRGGE